MAGVVQGTAGAVSPSPCQIVKSIRKCNIYLLPPAFLEFVQRGEDHVCVRGGSITSSLVLPADGNEDCKQEELAMRMAP